MRYLIGLMVFLSILTAQVTDKNFKDEVGDGFTVEKDLDESVVKGIKGFEDAKVITVKSDALKKVCRKLRIRNFPSIGLFHDGDKVDVWKADMDGEVDCSSGDIKDAIENALAGDSY